MRNEPNWTMQILENGIYQATASIEMFDSMILLVNIADIWIFR